LVQNKLDNLEGKVYSWDSQFIKEEFFAEAKLTNLPIKSKGNLICLQTIEFAGRSQKHVLHSWKYSVKGM